jgi:lipopolysaccharide export system protein LptA
MNPAATRRRRSVLLRFLPALGITVFCLSGLLPLWPAQAADALLSAGAMGPLDPSEPWQVEADRMRYDQASDEYIAEGNVVIRPDRHGLR